MQSARVRLNIDGYNYAGRMKLMHACMKLTCTRAAMYAYIYRLTVNIANLTSFTLKMYGLL